MKNLLFTLEYPPSYGGISNYYANLVAHWPEEDEIFVLHNNNNKLIKKWAFPKWIFAFWHLHRAVRKNKINHLIIGHLLPLGTVAYYYNFIFRKKTYTIFLHGMDLTFAQKTNRKRNLTVKILHRAKNIICANTYTSDLVKKIVDENEYNKIYVINPGINPTMVIKENIVKEIYEKYNLSGKLVLFSVSRLVKRKGFDKVIAAMPEVMNSVPNLHYFIAGDGPDKQYLEARAKGINNITFLGTQTEDEKWAWFKNCDIFIMTSRDIDGDFEGFGIVYLEANLCGKPVIAGDTGGVRDAVKGAESGILVDPENTERIASAIVALSQDGKLRKILGEQGKERAVRDFNWEGQIKKIYNIINK